MGLAGSFSALGFYLAALFRSNGKWMKSLFTGWLVFVVIISLMPVHMKMQLGTMGHLHAAGHFFTFLVTALLLCRELEGLAGKVAGCFSALALAVILEALQVGFYRHPFEWTDVGTDASGIATGAILMTLILLSEKRPVSLPGK